MWPFACPSLPSFLCHFSMRRSVWLIQCTPISYTDGRWEFSHSHKHTHYRGDPVALGWMWAAAVRGAVASLWRSMGPFHPERRMLHSQFTALRALGVLYTDTVVSSDSLCACCAIRPLWMGLWSRADTEWRLSAFKCDENLACSSN